MTSLPEREPGGGNSGSSSDLDICVGCQAAPRLQGMEHSGIWHRCPISTRMVPRRLGRLVTGPRL